MASLTTNLSPLNKIANLLRPMREAAAAAASVRRSFMDTVQTTVWTDSDTGDVYVEPLPYGNPNLIAAGDAVAYKRQWVRADQRGVSYRVLSVVNATDYVIATIEPFMGGSLIRCAAGVLKKVDSR